jgi:hypothetical protein
LRKIDAIAAQTLLHRPRDLDHLTHNRRTEIITNLEEVGYMLFRYYQRVILPRQENDAVVIFGEDFGGGSPGDDPAEDAILHDDSMSVGAWRNG